MSVNEENVSLDLDDESIVDAILGNPEIANLPLNSPEMIAALANAGKTDEESADLSEQDEDEPSDEEVENEDDDSESHEESQEKKKPSKGIQKRFDEMTRQIAELKEALTKSQQVEEVEQEAPKFDVPKPRVSDFDNVDAFYEADAEWRAEKAEFERSVKTEAETLQEQMKTMEAAWDQRATAFKAKAPDFDEVVNKDSVAKAKAMQPAYAYAFKIEQGPEVIYNLLNDAEKLAEFKAADAIEQVAIMAEIKASLSQPKKTIVSGAPTPPKKLPSASSAAKTVYKDDMSDAEFDRLLASELKRTKKRF